MLSVMVSYWHIVFEERKKVLFFLPVENASYLTTHHVQFDSTAK